MQIKLSIKDLSEIVNVPASTIRYYCNSGIFNPSGTLDNGYRYFTIGKIEELRLITYLRHLDVPLNEITRHLNSRDMNDYETILKNQLEQTSKKIKHLNFLESRLKTRLTSLDYIKNLPPLDTISIETFPIRKILKLDIPTHNQYEFEVALLNFETKGDLPPSLIVGDQGFIVDLQVYKTRNAEEFIGMYMDAEEEQYKSNKLYTEIPASKWLTVYFRGDHNDALTYYEELMAFAHKKKLKLDNYAFERVLIDHYISNNPDNYVTEIQIRIL